MLCQEKRMLNIYKVKGLRKGDLDNIDIVLACTNDKELNERISKKL